MHRRVISRLLSASPRVGLPAHQQLLWQCRRHHQHLAAPALFSPTIVLHASSSSSSSSSNNNDLDLTKSTATALTEAPEESIDAARAAAATARSLGEFAGGADEDSSSVTQRQQDQEGEADDDDATFDIMEATRQEIHDLVVAMDRHKRLANKNGAKGTWDLHEHGGEQPPIEETYTTVAQWEEADKHFQVWIAKLEQLLTPEIMASIMRSAEFCDRDPAVELRREQVEFQQQEQQQRDEENHMNNENENGNRNNSNNHNNNSGGSGDLKPPAGFTRHPLSLESHAADGRSISRTQRVHTVAATKRHLYQDIARFFTHTPYQLQVARPDVAPELMQQARAARDKDTLRCLRGLADYSFDAGAALGVNDQTRVLRMVATALRVE